MTSNSTTPDSPTEQDIRYCTCIRCGGKMWLVYDKDESRYLAMCEPCNIVTALPDDPNFTN